MEEGEALVPKPLTKYHCGCILVLNLTIKDSQVTWRKRPVNFAVKKCQSKALRQQI